MITHIRILGCILSLFVTSTVWLLLVFSFCLECFYFSIKILLFKYLLTKQWVMFPRVTKYENTNIKSFTS